MSHPVNDNIIDKMNDLYSLIDFLTEELKNCSIYGKFDEADAIAGELHDVTIELEKLREQF